MWRAGADATGRSNHFFDLPDMERSSQYAEREKRGLKRVLGPA